MVWRSQKSWRGLSVRWTCVWPQLLMGTPAIQAWCLSEDDGWNLHWAWRDTKFYQGPSKWERGRCFLQVGWHQITRGQRHQVLRRRPWSCGHDLWNQVKGSEQNRYKFSLSKRQVVKVYRSNGHWGCGKASTVKSTYLWAWSSRGWDCQEYSPSGMLGTGHIWNGKELWLKRGKWTVLPKWGRIRIKSIKLLA